MCISICTCVAYTRSAHSVRYLQHAINMCSLFTYTHTDTHSQCLGTTQLVACIWAWPSLHVFMCVCECVFPFLTRTRMSRYTCVHFMRVRCTRHKFWNSCFVCLLMLRSLQSKLNNIENQFTKLFHRCYVRFGIWNVLSLNCWTPIIKTNIR